MFPTWERFIPSKGTIHSQPGNISVPAWEYTLVADLAVDRWEAD